MGKGAKTKGYLKNLVTGKIMKFMFNPSSISDSRDIKYSVTNSCGASYPKFHYVGGDVLSISLDLLLKGSTSEIKTRTKFLENCVPQLKSSAKFQTPPRLMFVYGATAYTVVITNISREFTAWDSKLNPTEVTVSLSLKVVA